MSIPFRQYGPDALARGERISAHWIEMVAAKSTNVTRILHNEAGPGDMRAFCVQFPGWVLYSF